MWPCLTSLSLAAWSGGCSQQRPGRTGVHLRLPALSLTPLPWGTSRVQQKIGDGTVCSPDLQAFSSRAKRTPKVRVKGPVQEACLGHVGWRVPLAAGCPRPSRNAGLVSSRPSWLGAAGRRQWGVPALWLPHPQFRPWRGSVSCREGGTWPGSPQERAAKPEPFLVWGEWRAREAWRLRAGNLGPWTAGMRDSPFLSSWDGPTRGVLGTVSTPRLSMEPGLAGGQGAVPGVGTCCLSTLPRH